MATMKKSLTVGMTLALAAGVSLTACGKEAKKDANPVQSSGSPEVKKDISVSVYDRGNVPSSEGTTESNRWTKWISENGPANAKFVPIPRNDSSNKFNILFASGSAPDLIFEFSPKIRTPWYESKQLMPLDDMINKYSKDYKELLTKNPALRKAGTKPDGKLYEFGRLALIEAQRAIIVRKDWLDKLGLKAPQTTEELYQVAKAFAEKDPDGNGKKDTYGIALSYQSEATIDQVFQNVDWYINNGKIERTWDQAKAALEFKKKLYDEGIVDKDFINDKNGAKAKQDFVNGKLGIYPVLLNFTEHFVTNVDAIKKNVPTAELTLIPYPKSPAGQFNPTFSNPVQMTAVVNAKAKNPDAVMKHVDFMSRPATSTTLLWGLEGTHYKKGANGCPEITDQEKFKNEVSYTGTGDYTMLQSNILDGKCAMKTSLFNTSQPNGKTGLDLYNLSRKVYLDKSKAYSEITHSEHVPSLPKDLDVIDTNMLKKIGRATFKSEGEIWIKAVVSGKSYTPEQAVADAKAAWEQAGGKKIEEFRNEWYKENKDKAFLAADIYEMMEKQLQELK